MTISSTVISWSPFVSPDGQICSGCMPSPIDTRLTSSAMSTAPSPLQSPRRARRTMLSASPASPVWCAARAAAASTASVPTSFRVSISTPTTAAGADDSRVRPEGSAHAGVEEDGIDGGETAGELAADGQRLGRRQALVELVRDLVGQRDPVRLLARVVGAAGNDDEGAVNRRATRHRLARPLQRMGELEHPGTRGVLGSVPTDRQRRIAVGRRRQRLETDRVVLRGQRLPAGAAADLLDGGVSDQDIARHPGRGDPIHQAPQAAGHRILGHRRHRSRAERKAGQSLTRPPSQRLTGGEREAEARRVPLRNAEISGRAVGGAGADLSPGGAVRVRVLVEAHQRDRQLGVRIPDLHEGVHPLLRVDADVGIGQNRARLVGVHGGGHAQRRREERRRDAETEPAEMSSACFHGEPSSPGSGRSERGARAGGSRI